MAPEIDHDCAPNSSVALAAKKATSGISKSEVSRVSTRALRWGAVFLVLLGFVVLFQWLGGAYSGEFSGADESAHFVTGLMIRDYITNGFPASPMKFAEDYYVHYPKVAFGMWGPLLHVIEAAWTLVFPPTRISLLLLMAIITAGTAFLLHQSLVGEFGTALGLSAALMFVAAPVVQRFTGMILADGLVALLDFCAAMAFARYLNTRRSKDALFFAIFVCLSILTKGNGVALVLLPAFAILFTRQFGLLRDRSLWIAAAIVLCIAGPWQYYSSRALFGIEDRHFSWTYVLEYSRTIPTLLGLGLFPVVMFGVYQRLIAPALKGSLDGKWAAAGALIGCVWTFHCLIPMTGIAVRYLIALIPPVILFLIAGVGEIADRLPIRVMSPRQRSWGVAAVAVLVFLSTAFFIPRKEHYGFDQVAELLERPKYRSTVVLVSSAAEGAEGEGMLISEVAMRDRRPSHIVLRATKMLSQSDWMGAHYRSLYRTPEEVMTFLRSIPVDFVVIHDEQGLTGTSDHALLQRTISVFSSEWQHVGTYMELGSTISVYHLKAATGERRGKIYIDLPYTLGHAIDY